MSARPLRVVVAGHDLKFFDRLRKALEETGHFEFREDIWSGHNRHDEVQSLDLLDWAEIVFCEWCLGNAVWYSHNLKPKQRLVIRFHRAEHNTVFPCHLKLEQVDMIAFVGGHIRSEAHKLFGLPHAKTCVIPNLVDVQHFTREKYEGAYFNIGLLGYVPRLKRLDRALDVLEQLKDQDDRYNLRVKGAHPSTYAWVWTNEDEREYYLQQWERINNASWGNSVVFDPPGADVPEWFQTVGFILSTSDLESFHLAVAEGMSSGAMPIIWNWEGARDIHPTEFIVSSAEEAAEQIDCLRKSPEIDLLCRQAREYVLARYDRVVIRDRWAELLLR